MSYQVDNDPSDVPKFPWVELTILGVLLWLVYQLGRFAGSHGC